jgi:translation initiation factor 2 beta subunit (eIF-2beta)/eIF-5
VILLIRVEYKNEMRNINESYIRGYEIELIDKKGRGDKDISFKKCKK